MVATQFALGVREHLLQRLAQARRDSDALFGIVKPEALYDRPIAERHRIIFYVGHLEAFDWNLLGRRALDLPVFNAAFDKLFAFGIDPVDGKLPTDEPRDWPAHDVVMEYVRSVRDRIDGALGRARLDDPALPLLHDGLALYVAIEHRLMHAETLAYMLHQLPLNRKAQCSAATHRSQPIAQAMLPIPTGVATLGARRESGAFGWDNEFEQHEIAVPAFRISRFKVTNGEFLEFVRAGGYFDPALWEESAWVWKEKSRLMHPQFWMRNGSEWRYRTMFAEIPLPLDWPVYVSHAEANAFARWAGKQLPTEAQFHRAAYGTPHGGERQYPWGSEAPSRERGNFDFANWNPTPVNAHPAGRSAFGVEDLLGNGWEWTSTVFAPFDGFKPFAFYPGYSADFFDGKHYVMKGGSPRTAACMLRRSFRNWFQGHYPFVYAGFRLVEAA